MSSRSAIAALVLTFPGTALAGACCVGSTSSTPTRLGECERAAGGFGLGAEHGASAWDSSGRLQPSSVSQNALLATASAAVRLDPDWQVGMTLPGRVNHYQSDSLSGWGGGPADLRVVALWSPSTERPRSHDQHAGPVPVFQFGARAPTGRDWTHSQTPLAQDVTGLSGPALMAGGSVERTLDKWPWSVGSAVEVGVDRARVQPTIQTTASIGRTLGSSWTVASSLRHQLSWASLDVAAVHGTSVGGQLIHGRPVRWRTWVGAESSVPLPGLGAGSQRIASASLGAVLIR